MTFNEWLEWAMDRETSFELIDGEPFAMSPQTAGHVAVNRIVANAVEAAIREAGKPCRVLSDGVIVKIDEATGYEPDALIYCGEKVAPETVVIEGPLVVFEVISPGSVAHDTITKLEAYFRAPSIMHYVIVDPWAERVVMHSRRTGGEIVTLSVTEPTFALDPPGITLAPQDFWDRD